MYHNIPAELRDLPQWVTAREDKVPLHPRTGRFASVKDPSTWASFEEATRSGYPYIGFVLTEHDPYCIIDLDNKPTKPLSQEQKDLHKRILDHFVSYTERSASGLGYHIIVKGKVPDGVHSRDSVEIYSSARYMICTGNAVRHAPIADYQDALNSLYNEMKGEGSSNTILDESVEGHLSDQDLVEMACNAANGDKFTQLCQGKWDGEYPSQSEADLALISMLVFYTRDNEQVRRIFRMSQLGKREKALKNNVYLNRTIGLARKTQGHDIPNVDFSALQAQATTLLASKHKDPTLPVPRTTGTVTSGETPVTQANTDPYLVPPGLVGELAKYIYESSVKPIPEISLATSLAWMAGTTGRAFNIKTLGLNLYLIILADTGRGKEGATQGVDRLVSAIRPHIPQVDDFVGPSHFASGQALVKTLDQFPSLLTIWGEIALKLQQLNDPRANAADLMTKQCLLDLYHKSGYGNLYKPIVYSDRAKNTSTIPYPCFSILGESNPQKFFANIDTSHISEGLVPRFSFIEYIGPAIETNEYAGQPPSKALLEQLLDTLRISLQVQSNNTVINVAETDAARIQFKNFEKFCLHKVNNRDLANESELWNRAHLKSLRVAALLAVGCNPHSPVVDTVHTEWAIDFAMKDVETVASRFRSGDVGSGDSKMLNDVKKHIERYLTATYTDIKSYNVDKKMFDDKIIPYVFLQRRTASAAAFRNDRRGASKALKDTLGDMVLSGYLQEVPKSTLQQKYSSTGVAYMVVKAWND
jgi:hypothetical protein